MELETISIEADVDMKAVGVHAKTKEDMTCYHSLPPVPVLVTPSEEYKRNVINLSP